MCGRVCSGGGDPLPHIKERAAERRQTPSRRGAGEVVPSGGEGLLRPRPQVTATPTAGDLSPSGRAVRGGPGWQGAADGVATGVVIRAARQAVRKLQVQGGVAVWAGKMQAEGRRARLKRAACKATIGRSRPAGESAPVIGMPGTCGRLLPGCMALRQWPCLHVALHVWRPSMDPGAQTTQQACARSPAYARRPGELYWLLRAGVLASPASSRGLTCRREGGAGIWG